MAIKIPSPSMVFNHNLAKLAKYRMDETFNVTDAASIEMHVKKKTENAPFKSVVLNAHGWPAHVYYGSMAGASRVQSKARIPTTRSTGTGSTGSATGATPTAIRVLGRYGSRPATSSVLPARRTATCFAGISPRKPVPGSWVPMQSTLRAEKAATAILTVTRETSGSITRTVATGLTNPRKRMTEHRAGRASAHGRFTREFAKDDGAQQTIAGEIAAVAAARNTAGCPTASVEVGKQ